MNTKNDRLFFTTKKAAITTKKTTKDMKNIRSFKKYYFKSK